MRRREFLQSITAAVLSAGVTAAARAASSPAIIQTVRGPVPAAELGPCLPHEHVLVDFVGAAQVSPLRYDADEVFAAALPHLRRAHELGARALFECTPAYLGRDPRLLARLSAASGLHLVTNTGFYGARQNKFIPDDAREATAAELSTRWIREAREGIGESRIKPGFIKSGVDADARLSPFHRTLVAAGALTHAATGLTIAVHTGRGPGLATLDILHEHGVAGEAFVWVHAQGARDDDLFAAADRGAWLSFDGINTPTLARHLHLCREMKQRGHLRRVLLSHDAGWFDPAKPGGGTFRGYELLWTRFLPLLRENGFSSAEVGQLLTHNPADAFAVRPRLRG